MLGPSKNLEKNHEKFDHFFFEIFGTGPNFFGTLGLVIDFCWERGIIVKQLSNFQQVCP